MSGGGVLAELDVNVPDLNFGDLLDAVAAEVPERLAVIHGERILSWRTFDERSNRLARYLHAQGLSPDSKVAFYLRNTPAYLELFAACAKARCVHANVNYRGPRRRSPMMGVVIRCIMLG